MQYPWLPWAGKTAAVPLTCIMANEPEHAHTPMHIHTLDLSVTHKQTTKWWCVGSCGPTRSSHESRSVNAIVDCSAKILPCR